MDGYTRAGLEANGEDMLPFTSAKLCMVATGLRNSGKQWNHSSDGSQVSGFDKALPVFKKKTKLKPTPLFFMPTVPQVSFVGQRVREGLES